MGFADVLRERQTMTENAPEAPTTENENTGGEDSGYTPPATQDELNRILDNRLARERAKYADYADLKAKAEKFDGQVEAQKSETERVAERLAAAEKAATVAQGEALRYRIAARYHIEDSDAEYFLRGTNEDELVKAAERLVELRGQSAERAATKRGPYAASEGKAPANVNDRDAQARAILGFP